MKKPIYLLIIFSLIFKQMAVAQQWFTYSPTSGFDINTVDILKPGWIVTGGGGYLQGNSLQVMFSSPDYGISWVENPHDGYFNWNNSIVFSDTLNGFGVGLGGRIINSGDGGLSWPNVNTVINRDFNKIINVSPLVYYAVGGKQADDSIQTIIKSTDGGLVWNVVYDTAGPWLKSVYFINALNGFAVGDSGVILNTTNGGTSWNAVAAPILRNFEAITFINADTGYIAGGSQALGRSTILQTVNGGTTWNVLSDNPGGILNDITFANGTDGYIVGDSATVLKTTNAGSNWSRQFISTSLTGSETFRAVKFYDSNFGVIGGRAGVLCVYTGWPLDLFTLGPVSLDSADVQVYASVNTHGNPEAIQFVYSTDSTFSTYLSTQLQSFTSDTFQVNGVQLSALTPNTRYYYFIKGGSKTGDTLSFYTGAPTVPEFATLPGTVINSVTLGLAGEVHGFNPVTNMVFEYGVTPNLGSTIVASPVTANDTSGHAVSATLNAVQPLTIYYYRLLGLQGTDTLRGDIYFAGNLYNILETLPATYESDTNVDFNGQEQGFPGAVSLNFEYWIANGPVQTSGRIFNYPESDSLRTILDGASGLLPNHFYYYHIKAQSSAGINYGNTVSFFTGNLDSVLQTLPAMGVTSTSAMLQGFVNYFTDSATLSFEYGTDSSLGNTLTPSPATINDSLYHNVSALLSGVPNTFYYYRLKAVLGNGAVLYGDILSVFLGGDEIPNWDFQNWTSSNYVVPQGWTLGNSSFSRVAGHSGNYAVKVNGLNGIILGWPSDDAGIPFRGGQAIASRPDSLIFYVNSLFDTGDTGSVLIFMHKGDSVVAMDAAVLPTNTNGAFQRISVPISYLSGLTPDTFVLVFITANLANNYSNSASPPKPSLNTSITIDDISFSPSNPVIYNNDFETWYVRPMDLPDSWIYSSFIAMDSAHPYPPIVSKVYFNPPGDYAAEVKNVFVNGVGWVRGAFSATEETFASDQQPSFPVLARHSTLNGYYKAAPVGNDTMLINITMFYQDQVVGSGRMVITDSTNGFTPFTIPIWYTINSVIPDSANLQVSSATTYGVYGPSSITIDKLRFDGFGLDTTQYTLLVSTVTEPDGIMVYPNPTNNLINVEIATAPGEEGVVQLFNISGQKVKEMAMAPGEQRISMSVGDMAKGIYLLKWICGNEMASRKIIVIK